MSFCSNTSCLRYEYELFNLNLFVMWQIKMIAKGLF